MTQLTDGVACAMRHGGMTVDAPPPAPAPRFVTLWVPPAPADGL